MSDLSVTKHCIDADTPQEAEAKLRRAVCNSADWHFEYSEDNAGPRGTTRHWFTTQ